MSDVPYTSGFLFRFAVFFLHISSNWVKIRLCTKNQLPRLPESALKVPVVEDRVGGFLPTHAKVELACANLYTLSTS